MAAPINALLSYADSTDTWIRCGNDQVWLTFWNLIAMVRQFGEDEETWPNLFSGELGEIVSVPKRVGRPLGKGHVMWDTGDAVLGIVAAINCATREREYILAETQHYLDEINPPHRRIAIGDAEQLAATCIVIAWSHPTVLLLLGTDNQNVLSWAKRGYSKKGAALVLIQETARWVAVRKCQVEGVYVRSGHNFSPDWMTRTPSIKVHAWAGKNGFARAHFQAMREELAHEYRENIVGGIAMPLQRTISQVTDDRICVEWNSSGGVVASVTREFGMEIQFIGARHDNVTNQFCERYGYEAYSDGAIFLFGGSARTESEVVQFRELVKIYKPQKAVLIAPYGVGVGDCAWDVFGIADSTRYGDVMGSLWKIGVIGIKNLAMLTGPSILDMQLR